MIKRGNTFRYIAGYAIGFFVFIVFVPFALYKISRAFNHYILMGIITGNAVRIILALTLLLIGLFFGIWSNVSLYLIGKGGPTDAFGVSISPRTRHLVIKGPYRFTRNPMVFGTLACYLAIAVYLNSIICLVLLIVLIPLAVIYIKTYEEKRLLKDFGEEYLNYTKAVSMILPWPSKMKLGRR